MTDHSAPVTVRVADALRTRRNALTTLAAAALVAGVEAPRSASAKKKRKSRKSKKQAALQRCRTQAAPCREALELVACEGLSGQGLESCLTVIESCCDALGECNAPLAMERIVTIVSQAVL
jgi:hypothetical protein